MDGSHPVFTRLDGSPFTKDIVRGMFRRAEARCGGVPDEKKDNLGFHDLRHNRHTTASLMVRNGVSPFEVAKILGHKTLAMTMRYAHFAPDAARASLGGFDQALSGLGVLSSAKVK